MAVVRTIAPEELNGSRHPYAAPVPSNQMIVWIDTGSLKPAPWNPPRRTSRRALAPLIQRMREEGFESFRPILLSKDGYIGDGHRRWTAAQILKLEKVPVIYTEKTVEELWAGNLGARVPLAKEWMAVKVHGGVKTLPPHTAEQVESLLLILGEEGVRYLIEREQSPDIWRVVWRIGQYCKRSDNTFLRKATYWLIKHKMIIKTRKAMSDVEGESIDSRILVQAIENDIPLKSSWGFKT